MLQLQGWLWKFKKKKKLYMLYLDWVYIILNVVWTLSDKHGKLLMPSSQLNLTISWCSRPIQFAIMVCYATLRHNWWVFVLILQSIYAVYDIKLIWDGNRSTYRITLEKMKLHNRVTWQNKYHGVIWPNETFWAIRDYVDTGCVR